MIIDELWRVGSWLISSNTHCDVLEERSGALLEEMHALKAQQEQDGIVHKAEIVSVEEAHANLDRLEGVARAIEAEAAKALPALVADEAAFRGQLERIQNEAVAILVPDALMDAEVALLQALKQITGE